jgi:hypothetical protein
MNQDREDGTRKPPGPDPEHLKIDREDWGEAVREALRKKKPAEGWPEAPNEKKGREG